MLQYGLYAAVMPPLAYALLGNCREMVIGPTGIMGLMVSALALKHPGYAPLLALINGVVIIACAVLRLGFLVDLFSVPVISAFVSAAAIAIPASQLKNLVGVRIDEKSGFPGLVGVFYDLGLNISNFRLSDCLLGCCCIVFLLLFKVSRQFLSINISYRFTHFSNQLF